MDTPRKAWETDELSEEWIPQAAETSSSASASGIRSPAAGGRLAGAGGVGRTGNDNGTVGSVVVASQVGTMVEQSAAGPGSVVVTEQAAAEQQEDPPPWLQAAVNGLGNMFGPNRLQRMFEQPADSSAQETPGRASSSSFVTPSAALHRRSLKAATGPASQSPESLPGPSDTFEFHVPRTRTSWSSQPHFGTTQATPESQVAGPSAPAQPLEPTPRPRQGRYLRSSQTAPAPFERDLTTYSEDTDGSAPSIAFAHETPAPRQQAVEAGADDQLHALAESTPADEQAPGSAGSNVFSYPYDSFTRVHLSRLVEEIDDLSTRSAAAESPAKADVSDPDSVGPGHSTPPPEGAGASHNTPLRGSLERQRQEEQHWADSFLEPSSYARESTDGGENDVEEGEDESRDWSANRDRSRSSKRIRLHASSSLVVGDGEHARTPLARRCVDSLVVASGRARATPARPLSSRRPRLGPGATSLATPSASRRAVASPSSVLPATPGGEGGKRNLLAEAQELMARIKAKTPHLASRTSSRGALAVADADEADDPSFEYGHLPVQRPHAPTPMRSAMPRPLADSQASGTDAAAMSPVTPLLDQGPETTEEESELRSEEWERAAQSMRIQTPSKSESPRKLLRRLTAADEVDMEEEQETVWEVQVEDQDALVATPIAKADDGRHDKLVLSAAASLRRVLTHEFGTHKPSTMDPQQRSQGLPPPPYSGASHPHHPFAASTSRTVSSATAPSTATGGGGARYSHSTVNSHANWPAPAAGSSRGGLMTIAPEDVEDLLAQGRVGNMMFDPQQGKWVRSKRAAGASGAQPGGMVIEAPGLPAAVVEESEWRAEDEEAAGSSDEDDDIFKDIESLTSRRAGSMVSISRETWDAVDDQLDAFEDPEEGEHEDEEESAVPVDFEDNELEATSEDDGVAAAQPGTTPRPQPPVLQPRSALKARGERPRTQVDEVRDEPVKGNRSVSFSDGKTSGKIVLETPRVALDAPQLGVPDVSARTKRLDTAMDKLQTTETPGSSSSDSASTSLLGLSGGRRIRPKSAFRRSTSADDDRRANGNATFLTECSFGVSHDHVVKALTDVEPYEPAWEHLKVVDLAGKQIESVVRLKEFLPRLDEINLRNNRLAYVTGLSGSLRTLLVAENLLSGVASFGHLANLERLDISNNQLESLSQLSCLHHLRELKADSCGLVDVAGIAELDGLVRLSLKANSLQVLKLGYTKWSRLEVLNLSRNSITEIEDLHRLSSLQLLNLDHNDLYSLELAEPMPRLRILRLSYNQLDRVDVRSCPNLRTLFIDNCDLAAIDGASRLRKLENLSVRDQRSKTTHLPVKHVRDVKRLYLSGNRIPADLFSRSYFNLVYLELAMTQAASLPESLAELIPNVRTLNLNYNFLHDLRPLAGLGRLQKLTVLGSRLKTCGSGVVDVLQTLPELELLDLRLNPATLGFYPPLLVDDGGIDDDGAPHSQYRILSSRASWAEVDAKFRRALPNAYYLKRATYRAAILHSCPRLRILDGLLVAKADRTRAAKLLRGLERKLDQGADPAELEFDCSVATTEASTF